MQQVVKMSKTKICQKKNIEINHQCFWLSLEINKNILSEMYIVIFLRLIVFG